MCTTIIRWWKVCLAIVCVEAGFSQIQSHTFMIYIILCSKCVNGQVILLRPSCWTLTWYHQWYKMTVLITSLYIRTYIHTRHSNLHVNILVHVSCIVVWRYFVPLNSKRTITTAKFSKHLTSTACSQLMVQFIIKLL